MNQSNARIGKNIHSCSEKSQNDDDDDNVPPAFRKHIRMERDSEKELRHLKSRSLLLMELEKLNRQNYCKGR